MSTTAIDFVHALFDAGRVRVASAMQPPAELRKAVLALDHSARAQLAFDAPALLPAVAEWALLTIYRACQALVYREIPPDAIHDALSQPCPAGASPQTCYSADLALCFLPDVLRLAAGIAAQDPLVVGLLALARQWPLSSVGVKNVGEIDIAPFINHPTLRRLYADRIIERADLSRLNDPAVREAVRESLGAHRQLSPTLAAAVEHQP